MKQIVTALAILFCITSCRLQSDKVSLSINLSGECEKEIRLVSPKDTVNTQIQPDSSYVFNYTTDSIIDVQYFINGYRVFLKLMAGDKVNLTLKGKTGHEFDLVGGKYQELNDYNLFKSQNLKFSWSKDESLTDSTTFKNKMDDISNKSEQHISKLLHTGLVDESWAEKERMETKYWIYTRIVSYPFMYAAYDFKKVPEFIPSFSKELVSKEILDKEEVVTYGSGFLGNLLYNYGKIHEKQYTDVPNPSSIGNLKMMRELVSNPKVKSMAAQMMLSMQLRDYSDANIAPVMQYFTANCLDEKVKKEMLAKVEEISVLGPGKQAPEIELIDMDGKIHHLSDYKGKKVYIDVWATYCGKCIAEMPAVHKLEEDYKDKNWIFLMVSLDTDNAKWQTKAKELGHLDRQFIVKDGHKSQFNKDYRIGYAPRYIIVDSKGKLVNFNAPFPSDKKTRRIMDKVI